jgi:hypothetical protein
VLNTTEIGAAFEQMRGKRVPKGVRRAVRDACSDKRPVERPAQV